MGKISNDHWRVIINAICTIITTVIGALTMTSCAAKALL
ncbi:MAG: smalltalk protein [Bacteroidales bacterium]|nr:smalltalk protein [Bacteroidales bacterium]